jgi:hypothetical protein
MGEDYGFSEQFYHGELRGVEVQDGFEDRA